MHRTRLVPIDMEWLCEHRDVSWTSSYGDGSLSFIQEKYCSYIIERPIFLSSVLLLLIEKLKIGRFGFNRYQLKKLH